MDINKNCKLFLRGVYLYDISSCHYVILEKLGFDVSKIDKDDKAKRNIQIGLAIRDNPRLGSMLRNVTTSVIDEYLKENSVSESDIILRQYDGILLTRRLSITQGHIPLDLQKFFDIFIISVDRTSYLGLTSDSTVIKGVPNRYPKMDEVYKKLSKINYNSRESVFKGLEEIRRLIFYTDDPSLFCINGENDKYTVFLKQYGEIEVSASTAKLLDIDEIDRQKYFDFYLKPFTISICKEFL